MDTWHATFLGLRHLPREVTAFEVEVFFQFSAEEARIIDAMKARDIVMTSDGSTALSGSKKSVHVVGTGDLYSYFPLSKSEGMRILVFQRGPKATSLYTARDASVKK